MVWMHLCIISEKLKHLVKNMVQAKSTTKHFTVSLFWNGGEQWCNLLGTNIQSKTL